jgi:hypothetical protein
MNFAITSQPASSPPSMWHFSILMPNSLARGGRTNLDEIYLDAFSFSFAV